MKTTKNISKKIISLSLAFLLIVTMFAGCKKTENVKTSAEGTESKTENSTTEPVESESVVVTDDNGEPMTDKNGSTVTETVTQSDKADSSSQAPNTPISNSQTETTTKKSASSSKTETTTKKTTSSKGSYDKTITTKPAITTCSHNWKLISYTNGCYVYNCTKCDDYKSEERKMNPDDFMGNKSEYLELLRLVNKARRDAGLNELVYIDELQSGANIRAQEITQKFSHTRPNGENYSTVYDKYRFTTIHGQMFVSSPENIVSGADTAQQAFKAWMNSSGHKAVIMREDGFGFVASRCDGYWMMCVVCG